MVDEFDMSSKAILFQHDLGARFVLNLDSSRLVRILLGGWLLDECDGQWPLNEEYRREVTGAANVEHGTGSHFNACN